MTRATRKQKEEVEEIPVSELALEAIKDLIADYEYKIDRIRIERDLYKAELTALKEKKP